MYKGRSESTDRLRNNILYDYSLWEMKIDLDKSYGRLIDYKG